MQNDRIIYLDILRLLATLGVITLHVYCIGTRSIFLSQEWYIAMFGNGMVRWSVPLFVMISGALFLNPQKKVTLGNLVGKYERRLMISFVFWAFFYAIFFVAYKMFQGEKFSVDLIQLHFHLWFLPMLMGVYFLIPILKKVCEDTLMITWSIVIMGGVFLGNRFSGYMIPQFANLFKMNIVVGFAGYFMLGYFFTITNISKKWRYIIYAGGVVGFVEIIAGSILLSIHDKTTNLISIDYLSIPVAMTASSLFVLVKYNSRYLKDGYLKFLGVVRKDLFGVYLVHALWIAVFNVPLFRNATSQFVTLPIIVIVVFLLSLLLTKIIRRVPILRYVVE